MVRSMKILIHDERSDAPEFLLKLLANRGYRAGFAKNVTDITAMLSNDRYDFVLTNGKYKTLSADHYARLHTSVFIIGITDSQNHT